MKEFFPLKTRPPKNQGLLCQSSKLLPEYASHLGRYHAPQRYNPSFPLGDARGKRCEASGGVGGVLGMKKARANMDSNQRHPVLTNLSRERAKLRRIAFGRERPNSASGTAFFPSVPTSLELSVIIDVTGLRQTREENKKRDHRWWSLFLLSNQDGKTIAEKALFYKGTEKGVFFINERHTFFLA